MSFKFAIALALLPASALFALDLNGTWQGYSNNPDTKESRRTVIKIASSDENPIKLNFYAPDLTYLVFPGTITVKGSALKMTIPGIGATWTGKLSADGTTLTGTLDGFSVLVTWTLKRVPPEEEWPLRKPPVPARPLSSADPAFEVATIKPSNPDGPGRGGGAEGGGIVMRGTSLANLLRLVYDIHPNQIIGAPAWVTSDRYDIIAKVEGDGTPTQDQLKIMVAKLLADRFQLAFHREQKELPVYSVTVAKSGVRITKNELKNDAVGVIFRGPGSVAFNNAAMDDLCRMLQTAALDRPVVNKTGLSGKYDFTLIWTPEQLLNAPANVNALQSPDKAEPPPDIYVAVQQQLGLKIDAAKLSTEVLVIDKVEKPSDN
jgi:bla regulator protein blaR1